MKFIVDAQLPPALAEYLRKRGFDCEHVNQVQLGCAQDIEICRYAEAQDRIIISKDEDFLFLAAKSGLRFRLNLGSAWELSDKNPFKSLRRFLAND